MQGPILPYFTGNERNPYFWFAVRYPTDSVVTSVPVVFRQGQRLVRPR